MKKVFLFIGVALLAATVLAGCSASSFEVISTGSSITINAKNADTSKTETVDLTISGNGKLVFDASSLNKGKLKIAMKDTTGELLPEASVRAKEQSTYSVPEGEYSVEVIVLETADGTAKVTMEAN